MQQWTVPVRDGRLHKLLLTVQGGQLVFTFDSQVFAPLLLGGIIDDCAPLGANCVLRVGNRPPSSLGFSGCLLSAILLPAEAILEHPDEDLTTSSPSTVSPSTVSPSTVSPSTVSPSTVSPSTASPTTASPSTASPTTASPSTTSPTTASPSTVSPSSVSPSTVSPSTEPEATTFEPTTASPSTASPSTASPSTVSPSTVSPSTVTTPVPEVETTEEVATTEQVDDASTTSPTSASPSTAPKTEEETTEGPLLTTTTPALEIRTTESPTTSLTTASPTTVSLTTAAPTTESLTTFSPSTVSPSSISPTSALPTSASPTSASPSSASPTSASPTSASPTSASPSTASPTSASPSTASPTSASLTSASPTSASPTSASPTSASPSTESPTSAGPVDTTIQDLLATSSGVLVDGELCFDGLAFETVPAVQAVTAQFSVVTTVRLAPGSSGYIFSKSTAAGVRFYSLYATDTDVRMYYTTVAAPGVQRLVTWNIALRDNQEHRLLLSVVGASATLHVDNVALSTQALLGTVGDCEPIAADCVLTLGNRAPGRFFLIGCLSELMLWTDRALTGFPQPTTPSPTTQSPTTASPSTASPSTQSPSTQSPTTQSPTTQSPTTASPTTASPTTASPTTESPTTASPTTASPTTASPTTASPSSASPTTASAMTQSPTTNSPTSASPTSAPPVQAFDLLLPAHHNQAVARRPDGSYCFDGTNHLALNTVPAVAGSFSLAVVVQLQANAQDGYVLAKSTAAGSRFYSLYVTSTDVRMYYRQQGSSSQHVQRWTVAIRDGAPHFVTLSVTGTTAVLLVDGVLFPAATLLGQVADCGAIGSDCVLHIGNRAPGRFFLQGCLSRAWLFPDAFITNHPATAAPSTAATAAATTVSTATVATVATTSTAAPTTTTTTAPAGGIVSCSNGLTLDLKPCTCSTNCFSCNNDGSTGSSECLVCFNSWYLFDGACFASCDSFRGFTTPIDNPNDGGFGRLCGPD